MSRKESIGDLNGFSVNTSVAARARCREAVAHRAVYVRDSWPLVERKYLDSRRVTADQSSYDDRAAAGMPDEVRCRFGNDDGCAAGRLLVQSVALRDSDGGAP